MYARNWFTVCPRIRRGVCLPRTVPLSTARRRLNTDAVRIDKSKLDQLKIYRSTSLDPYYNLSFEDWLFRKTSNSIPTLLFYTNRSSVVIGKNQNPWKETNPDLLSRDGIPLIRRRSGGGTVYHDEGNINFSLLVPRSIFSRSLGAGIVENALRNRLRIDRAGVNDRGDLILWDEASKRQNTDGWKKMSRYLPLSPTPTLFAGYPSCVLTFDIRGETIGRKHISGSAYKIVAQRAYHHGTMLISSDLGSLGVYLKSQTPDLITKSVDSVRSPVTTLRTAHPGLTQEDFVKAVAEEFWSVFNKTEREELDAKRDVIEVDENSLEGDEDGERGDYIRKGIAELKSWEWTYGSTPEFFRELRVTSLSGSSQIRITVKNAIVTSVDSIQESASIPTSTANDKAIEVFRSRLIGRTYGRSPEGDFEQVVTRAVEEINGIL